MFCLLYAEFYSKPRSWVEGNKVIAKAPLSNGCTQSFGKEQMSLVTASVLPFLARKKLKKASATNKRGQDIYCNKASLMA